MDNGEWEMKDLAEIKKLIDRFFEGDTTLEDEQWLYGYFRQTKELPEELEAYRNVFLDFDAIALADSPAEESARTEQAADLPVVEQPVSFAPPKYRNLWLQVAGIAASIAIIVGSVWAYRAYEGIRLQSIYGGSYMIVDGERIDNLREILPQIKSALSLADAVGTPSPTDLIDQAEQDLLDNIQDAQERERIRRLLNQ
ncbi:MAG: hypothetical protein IJ256_03225 [Bacteroidaceae bacterium]|nr:hypothetical protein [Bacteroidaceae bacterium]